MNKHSIVTGFKVATLSLFFAAAFSANSFAGTNNNEAAGSSKAFNVKYIGNVDEGYVFNVKYDNIASSNFELIIKDEVGEVLYQKSFSDKNFTKKFQLNRSLIKAVFIIRPQHEAEQSFEVAVQSRVSEDVVISRL